MVKPRNPKLVANGMDSQNAILFVGTDNRLLSRREAAQQPCVCVCVAGAQCRAAWNQGTTPGSNARAKISTLRGQVFFCNRGSCVSRRARLDALTHGSAGCRGKGLVNNRAGPGSQVAHDG